MNNLLAATLDENLQGIVTKLQSLIDSSVSRHQSVQRILNRGHKSTL